jgi:hypothetical protein
MAPGPGRASIAPSNDVPRRRPGVAYLSDILIFVFDLLSTQKEVRH